MLDTNALLSISFALIANFASVVRIPPDSVPAGTADLQRLVVGSPRSPIDLHCVHRRATLFWIEDGAVIGYRSPGSFWAVQELEQLTNFHGVATLSTNEVLALAERTARGLVKFGDPFTNGAPILRPAGRFPNGEAIPFYHVTWPGPGKFGYAARIEVDARNGTIPALWVLAPQFLDLPYAAEISNRVWRADPPRPRQQVTPPRPPGSRRLTTNEVSRALENGRKVLAQFPSILDPAESLSGLNWEVSRSQPEIGPGLPRNIFYLSFTNEASWCAIDEGLVGFAAADCPVGQYNREGEKGKRFYGQVAFDPEALAREFEGILCRKFGFHESDFSELRRRPLFAPPALGETGYALVDMLWVFRPTRHRPPPQGTLDLAFDVQFDLLTGSIKSITFRDSGWRQRFARAQRKL